MSLLFNACFAQVPGAVADVIFEVEDEMGGEDGAARHDAALSALGIPAELILRLRQRSREHKQQAPPPPSFILIGHAASFTPY